MLVLFLPPQKEEKKYEENLHNDTAGKRMKDKNLAPLTSGANR